MSERFRVRVEGVRFAAAHFATFSGVCEPLHGHSYEVAAEVEGRLSTDSWVTDFVQLKALLRGICELLDHRFMLQRDSQVLELQEEEGAWKVRTPAGVGYVFPASDVVPLAVDNTTAERLSEWFAERLARALAERRAANVESIAIEVFEGPGQSARYTRNGLPLE